MLKLSITPKAESDQYLDQLEAGMKQLLSHPMLGADYGHVLAGYRRLQVELHAVFYQLPEHEVLVVRVLHEDMDAPQGLVD